MPEIEPSPGGLKELHFDNDDLEDTSPQTSSKCSTPQTDSSSYQSDPCQSPCSKNPENWGDNVYPPILPKSLQLDCTSPMERGTSWPLDISSSEGSQQGATPSSMFPTDWAALEKPSNDRFLGPACHLEEDEFGWFGGSLKDILGAYFSSQSSGADDDLGYLRPSYDSLLSAYLPDDALYLHPAERSVLFPDNKDLT